MWLTIESPMITTFNKTFSNMSITSPDRKTTFSTQIAGFIDDNNINITIHPQETSTSISTKITTMIETWNELLALSGGALSKTKCFYYALQWSWNNSQATLTSSSTEKVTIQDQIYQRTLEVKEINPPIGKRYLGIRIAPSGSMNEEFIFLSQEAKSYAHCLQGAYLTISEAITMNDTVWNPNMRYSLTFNTFTLQQCEKIEASYIPHYLNKLGFSQTPPPGSSLWQQTVRRDWTHTSIHNARELACRKPPLRPKKTNKYV